jgi:hypothetical protein
MTLLAGTGLLSVGCYSLQPATAATPAPGTDVALAINDAGRVALGGAMGPMINRVNGRLMSLDGDEYVVSVKGVDLLQGGFQAWSGETVRIKTSHVSALLQRKFSPARTIALGAALAGAAVILSGMHLGPLNAPPDTFPPDTGVARRGRPRIPTRTPFPPFLRSINPPRSH